MSAIKLFYLGVLDNGITRLQSQLLVGRNDADFIIENGVLKCYGYGKKGFDFYEYKEPFEVVYTLKEMEKQQL